MSSPAYYVIFIRIETKEDKKLYTPSFPTLDEAEVYANHMRLLLPKEAIVSEPYPIVSDSLEKEFKERCDSPADMLGRIDEL